MSQYVVHSRKCPTCCWIEYVFFGIWIEYFLVSVQPTCCSISIYSDSFSFNILPRWTFYLRNGILKLLTINRLILIFVFKCDLCFFFLVSFHYIFFSMYTWYFSYYMLCDNSYLVLSISYTEWFHMDIGVLFHIFVKDVVEFWFGTHWTFF